MEEKRYGSLDGLRTIACLGIVMMHMASQANNSYLLSGIVFEKIIPSFTDFVFLFMVISAFGMCCGYYDKILSGKIDLTKFYKKRYLKILPFFSILVCLDLIMKFSISSLYEAIADVSLTFGLFPNRISVIGVGWFLGLIFAFYMIFPFFCVLLENKKRAWLSLAATLILNYIGGAYFQIGRSNIVYSSCFFILGGGIFLYKEDIGKIKAYITFPILIVALVIYYLIGSNTVTLLFLSAAFMWFAIGKSGDILHNKLTSFISSISMEIYLSHMVIFRIVEKLNINTMIGNGILQYVVTVVVVIVGTIVFSLLIEKILEIIKRKIEVKCK